MHELFRGSRVARQHHALLGKVDLDIEFVESHPILEVAVEAIGLLDQDDAYARMLAQIFDHLAEVGPPGVLGGLDINIFLNNAKLPLKSIFSQQLALRRDRKAFFLLLF
ncbi:hypothetical protein NKH47_32950 [Mesorhizobium sp. M1060]|uniref:hypothetical protein n=1 Tax=unclassified Mesorhizobium TaxID=325217 RepID=UPI0004CDE295|nr:MULTISPECIES: hypothetical protein [unclassified Mesorhizobium]WJI51178.1 hypothetical protein NLY44_00075 [Mesorhizobium sp. C089B]